MMMMVMSEKQSEPAELGGARLPAPSVERTPPVASGRCLPMTARRTAIGGPAVLRGAHHGMLGSGEPSVAAGDESRARSWLVPWAGRLYTVRALLVAVVATRQGASQRVPAAAPDPPPCALTSGRERRRRASSYLAPTCWCPPPPPGEALLGRAPLRSSPCSAPASGASDERCSLSSSPPGMRQRRPPELRGWSARGRELLAAAALH